MQKQTQTQVKIKNIYKFTFYYNNVNYIATINKQATQITIKNTQTNSIVNKITNLSYVAQRLNYKCKQQNTLHNIALNTFLYICKNFDNLNNIITVNNNILNY